MDNGGVIPGLNEDWTFAGCKLFEWMAGLVSGMLLSSFYEKPGSAMPILLIAVVGTTLGLAQLRRQFPDEERGVRNYFMVLAGLAPNGIPAPAKIQPMWSGGPIKTMKADSLYAQLGLDLAFKERVETAERRSGIVGR